MSDTESGNSVSRRDFLRTAGKKAAQDALDTGTKIMPGGAIVREFLAAGDEAKSPEAPVESSPTPAGSRQGPLAWLASWRAKRDNPSK